jgi:hypothetical protein
MNAISWYAEATLVSDGHVFCAGSLAQCVRKWSGLPEEKRAGALIKLHSATDKHIIVDSAEIAQLALKPELARV